MLTKTKSLYCLLLTLTSFVWMSNAASSSSPTITRKRNYEWDLNEPSKESLEDEKIQNHLNVQPKVSNRRRKGIRKQRRQPPEWDIANKHLALNEDGSCKIHRPGCKDWFELSKKQKNYHYRLWSDLRLTDGKFGKYKNQSSHDWYTSLDPERKKELLERGSKSYKEWLNKGGNKELRRNQKREAYRNLSKEKRKEYNKKQNEYRRKRKAAKIQNERDQNESRKKRREILKNQKKSDHSMNNPVDR